MFGLKIIEKAIDGVSNYFGNKQKIKAAKQAGELAIIEAKTAEQVAVSAAKTRMAESDQLQTYDLDRIAMENMKTSYKDEVVLAIFLAPLVMAFTGFSVEVAKGFDAIAKMPTWYTYIVIGMIVVIYGMRGMLKDFLNGKMRKVEDLIKKPTEKK